MNVRIARLAVLFEDLRIEMYAIAERGKIQACDHIGDGYRRLYFVRRAIATVLEMKGGFQRLDQCPEFQNVLRSFTPEETADWRAAVTFLVDHEQEFRANSQRCRWPLSRTSGRLRVGLNLCESDRSYYHPARNQTADGWPIPKICQRISRKCDYATQGNKEFIQYYEDIVRLLMEALRHITKQLHILTDHYLWERFA
jgi:hypothetical protein